MGISLEEYARLHPQEQPEQERREIRATADAIADRQEAQERAEQLKASIQRQLEQGNAPQTILYTALTVIGILSHDEEWTEATHASLDAVYADLEQQSFLTDTATVAAERLEKLQADYNDRLRRQTVKQLQGYSRIQHGLNEVLNALTELEPETAITLEELNK